MVILTRGKLSTTIGAINITKSDYARPEPLPARHPGGLLRIDAAKAKAEENLDG